MPVAKPTNPDDQKKPQLILPDVVQETAVVDTFKENYNTLATFLSGARMTVDYYRQVAGRDDAPASQQDSLAAVWGSYQLIQGLEIRVTDFLSHQQTQDHNRGFRSNFTASIIGIPTPNEGDFMVMDMGNGQPVIASIVTPTDRGTPYLESATKVECKITELYTPQKKAIIDRKVIDRKIFSMELLRRGMTPTINHEDLDWIRRIKRSYLRMSTLYMRDFYSQKYHTLLVPDQAGDTYDPFLTKFVKATFEPELSPQLTTLELLGVEHSFRGQEMTLFDAFETMDEGLLASIAKIAGIVSGKDYQAKPAYRTIYYSGIRRIMAMKDSPFSVNQPTGGFAEVGDIQIGGVRDTNSKHILPVMDLTTQEPEARPDNPTVPFIHRVIHDEYYVFTQAFYEDSPGQSQLENMARKALTREVIDLRELTLISEYADKFNNLERFYYVPILMAIIRMVIGAVK